MLFRELESPTAELTSARADITEPRVTRDLLMCAPSFSLFPVAPEALARSLNKFVKGLIVYYSFFFLKYR